MMTPKDKAELAALITKAETEGMWLHCSYQDLWFSPAQLRDANANGRFICGVVNWRLRDPKEKLEQLKLQAATAARELDAFKKRLSDES